MSSKVSESLKKSQNFQNIPKASNSLKKSQTVSKVSKSPKMYLISRSCTESLFSLVVKDISLYMLKVRRGLCHEDSHVSKIQSENCVVAVMIDTIILII